MNAEYAAGHVRQVSRREVLTGLAMLSASGVALGRRPDKKMNYLGDAKIEKIIPTQIDRWKFVTKNGLVVPPEDQLILTLYSQLLTRVYYDGSRLIWLLIAYSADQTGFIQVHRPEFCYTASGYRLSQFAPHEIRIDDSRSITTNSLNATRDDTTEKLVYWTRIGHHIPLSWSQQKLTVAEENLRGFIPDAALIRISTQGLDEAEATRAIDQFAKAMIAAVPPTLRRAFVG